jgi:hypothetical protein
MPLNRGAWGGNCVDRSDLLDRMATLLKREIGPAVPDAYPKTQAFLGAVVLQKLATENRLTETHAEAAQADRQALLSDMKVEMQGLPQSVTSALSKLDEGGEAELCSLIIVLYAERETLGADRFDAILGRVRQDLRRAIDRRMEIAA